MQGALLLEYRSRKFGAIQQFGRSRFLTKEPRPVSQAGLLTQTPNVRNLPGYLSAITRGNLKVSARCTCPAGSLGRSGSRQIHNRPTQNDWRTARFDYAALMDEALTNRQRRELKARAQLLKPTLKVGKEGLSPGFLKATDDALAHHELVKVKFDEFKEQKEELAPRLAAGVSAQLITQVGHVIVLFRRKPAPLL